MNREQWLPIEGYVGFYAISDHGHVMSMNYHRTGLPGLLAPRKANGYLAVQLSRDGITRPYTIHRLVTAAFIGTRPAGAHINHRDGDKHNNALSNLEYCTPAENTQHAWRNGLHRKLLGEAHQNSKLTAAQVREIKGLLAKGKTHTEIAAQFGVSRSNISGIATHRTWVHVQEVLQ